MIIKQSVANELMDAMIKTICCAYANVEDDATQEVLKLNSSEGKTFLEELTREAFENFCETVGIGKIREGV